MKPSKENMKTTLESLLDILMKEQEALVRNDALAVGEMVGQKLVLIEQLEAMRSDPPKDPQSSASMVERIRELQETNFLLTKQALRFQENLLGSIVASVEEVAGTYSQRGGYNTGKQGSHLIDQKG